jgi:pilus assembly protein Flp/PilA
MLTNIKLKIRNFLVSEDGPTAVEYLFMMSLIVIVCLVAINTLGQSTNDSFSDSSTAITDVMSS